MSGHCNDHTFSAVTTVYAKPIFATDNTYPEQLPLEALYDHEDYVDLISAQEFGIESLFSHKTLLCLLIAKRTDALDEMETLILQQTTPSNVIATAQLQENRIVVSIGGQNLSLPNAENSSDLHSALIENAAPKAAWLAALGVWCTNYRVVLCADESLS